MNRTIASDQAAILGVEELPTVGLEQVVEVAALERRFDAKHLVEIDALPVLVAELGDHIHVLEVEGRRSTDYTSVYFDTPELRTYRDHVQRRRRRFKIRVRHYGDPTAAMLELKTKGRRQQTVKFRWPHPGPSLDHLDARAMSLLAEGLVGRYGLSLPPVLAPVATTRFRRITLVDLAAAERVTIDLGLTVAANGRTVVLGDRHAVVETKSPVRSGHAARSLRSLGVRRERVSKYCVGLVATHEDLRGNTWIPTLRHLGLGPAGLAPGGR